MSFITDILVKPVLDIIDKVVPNTADKDKAKAELARMALEGELREQEDQIKIALAQIDVNKTEAASTDPFSSRWRPAVGWTCVSGLFYSVFMQPLLPWVVELFGKQVAALPALDTNILMTLLFGMLGLGAYRSYDKKMGTAK